MREVLSEFKEKLAIVILSYADYESLELSLATHAKFSVNKGVRIFILQNGRGSYDCERTYSVALRYEKLFPKSIKVIDTIKPGIPYHSLKQLFNSDTFRNFEYVIKLDDDVMVLTDNWIDKLCECYIESKEKFGHDLAYVTSLVNNNPFGFKKIIEKSKELSVEYFTNISREHVVGCTPKDSYAPYRIIPKDVVVSGSNGTIWGYPYIARWLHKRTTMNPLKYIQFAENLDTQEVNNKERYSINCMLFAKNLWNVIYDGGNDDEHMCHAYCLKFNKKIIADLSIPMVHLFFFSQRNECRDLIEEIRSIYTEYLKLNFPIAICNNRLIEIENRIRFLEAQNNNFTGNANLIRKDLPLVYRKIIGGLICLNDNGLKYTVKHTIKKIFN